MKIDEKFKLVRPVNGYGAASLDDIAEKYFELGYEAAKTEQPVECTKCDAWKALYENEHTGLVKSEKERDEYKALAMEPMREMVTQREIDRKIALVEAKFRPEYNNHNISAGELHMIRKAITALYEIEGGEPC